MVPWLTFSLRDPVNEVDAIAKEEAAKRKSCKVTVQISSYSLASPFAFPFPSRSTKLRYASILLSL